MTEAWAISLGRSLLLAALSLYPASQLAQKTRTLTGRKKYFFLGMVLFPLSIPPLLPAYAYSSFELNFQTAPVMNEILYCLVNIFKTVPFTFLIYYLVPDTLSNSARHCQALLDKKQLNIHFLKGSTALAYLVSFLIIFNEYEIASMMRIEQWTINIFNAHAGGLSQSIIHSFQLAILPMTSSFVCIAVGLKILFSLNQSQGRHFTAKITNPKVIFIIFTCSLSLLFIYPVSRIILGGIDFLSLFQGQWMTNELINSLLFTMVATGCAWLLSFWLSRNVNAPLISIALLPGLCGSLILGLGFIYLFNLPGLSSLKQSAIPLTLALTVYGLPLAVLMQVFKKEELSQSVKMAILLPDCNRKPLLWTLRTLPSILFSMPLFCVIWFDLSLSALLAPAAMPGIFPRLYNLMHYSESEKLSATVILILFVPLLIFSGIIILSRIIAKRA